MSLASIGTEDKNENDEHVLEVQSKVIEHSIIVKKQEKIESNLTFINCPNNIIAPNIISPSLKKCYRKDITLFYSKIKFIRKKYNIKKSRKNNIDSLVKKAKSKFLKGIHDCLKYCLNTYIKRLPQNFIINTKIEYNKIYLNQTVEEVYTEFKILPNFNTLLERNMVQANKKDTLFYLMKSSFKDIYKIYLNSDLYKYDKNLIEKKSGKNIAFLYDFVACNITDYFLLNKGNHRTKSTIKKLVKFKSNESFLKKNKNLDVKFNILKLAHN